jgi:hypothetical protein
LFSAPSYALTDLSLAMYSRQFYLTVQSTNCVRVDM